MKLLVPDSSVWVEYFADRPKASAVDPLIADPARLIVPAVVVYEVYKRIKAGIGIEAAEAAVGRMLLSPVADLDSDLAMQAADLSIASRLAMADAMILSAARAYGAELVTLDADFHGVPGVRIL